MTDSEINDMRGFTEFKSVTFSKHKKTSAKKELLTCLLTKKVESACYWGAELICAGHFTDMWELIILYLSKHIHLGNPRLPIYLAMRFENFKTVIQKGYANDELRLRNNTKIRQIFAEIIATLCFSTSKHSIEVVKIHKEDEFHMTQMSHRLKAPSINYGRESFRDTDPKELYIAINELAYNISSKIKNTVESCYWLEWLMEYESICKKRKEKCECSRREFARVPDKYQTDIIFLAWDVLLKEGEKQHPLKLKIMKALLSLFCIRYTGGCKKRRRYVLYFAVSLLTESYDLNKTIISNKKQIENVVSQINIVYKDVKKNEEAPPTDYLTVKGPKSNLDKTVERLEKMEQLLGH